MIGKPLYFLLGGIALSAAIWLHGNWHGSKTTAASYKAQIAESNVKALKERQTQQEIVDALTQKYWNDLDTTNSKLSGALARLRDREVRASETSRANCKGASGAELSRQDGEFLTREAARGDRCAIALQRCYDYADKLQK